MGAAAHKKTTQKRVRDIAMARHVIPLIIAILHSAQLFHFIAPQSTRFGFESHTISVCTFCISNPCKAIMHSEWLRAMFLSHCRLYATRIQLLHCECEYECGAIEYVILPGQRRLSLSLIVSLVWLQLCYCCLLLCSECLRFMHEIIFWKLNVNHSNFNSIIKYNCIPFSSGINSQCNKYVKDKYRQLKDERSEKQTDMGKGLGKAQRKRASR